MITLAIPHRIPLELRSYVWLGWVISWEVLVLYPQFCFFGLGTLRMGSDNPVSFWLSSFNYRRTGRGPPSGAGWAHFLPQNLSFFTSKYLVFVNTTQEKLFLDEILRVLLVLNHSITCFVLLSGPVWAREDVWAPDPITMRMSSIGRVRHITFLHNRSNRCDHTSTNAMDPIRTPQLSVLGRE